MKNSILSKRSILPKLAAWMVILLAASPAFAQTEVYLFGGQSNMNQGIVDGFRAEMAKLHPGAVLVTPRSRASGRGLDSGFDASKWVGNPPGPGRSNFYAGTDPSDPNIGTAYTGMLKTWKEALSKIEGPYEIKGIFWVQGEQDSKNKEAANRYAANLKHLISRIHSDLDLPQGSVPFFYSSLETKKGFKAKAIVKAQQFAADKNSGDALSIPNAIVVDASGLPFGDNVHYTKESQKELGQRFAKAFAAASP